MKTRDYVVLASMLFLLSACGQTIQKEARYITQPSVTAASPVVPCMSSPFVIEPSPCEYVKIAILPFSDLTPDYPFNFPVFGRRNLLVTEALQDEFYRYGFMPALQEEVIDYLLNRGIIREVQSSAGATFPISPETGVLLRELNNTYSPYTDGMKVELINGINQNIQASMGDHPIPVGTASAPSGDLSGRLVTLDNATIIDLGYALDVDYVIRGRIIEFGTERYTSYNPALAGIVPFAFNLAGGAVFGVSMIGAYDSSDCSGCVVEPLTFAGKNRKAVVQLRMIVQNARTGNIVWANRTEVQTMPLSAFSNEKKRSLYAQAIRHAARDLVGSFVRTRVSGRYMASAALNCHPCP